MRARVFLDAPLPRLVAEGHKESSLSSKRLGKTSSRTSSGGETAASSAPRAEKSAQRPRYLVTFDGLMELPDDMDEMVESLEREVEIIRSPVLC